MCCLRQTRFTYKTIHLYVYVLFVICIYKPAHIIWQKYVVYNNTVNCFIVIHTCTCVLCKPFLIITYSNYTFTKNINTENS